MGVLWACYGRAVGVCTSDGNIRNPMTCDTRIACKHISIVTRVFVVIRVNNVNNAFILGDSGGRV